MKNLTIALALLNFFTSTVAQVPTSNWKLIAATTTGDIFVDLETLTAVSTDTYRVHMLSSFSKPVGGALSMISVMELNCKLSRSRALSDVMYSGASGNGDVLLKTNEDLTWHHIKPNSSGMTLMVEVCQHAIK